MPCATGTTPLTDELYGPGLYGGAVPQEGCPQGGTVAFREKRRPQRKALIADKTRDGIITEVEERIQAMTQSLWETPKREELGLSFGSTPPRPTRATPAISWPVLGRTSAFLGGGRP